MTYAEEFTHIRDSLSTTDRSSWSMQLARVAANTDYTAGPIATIREFTPWGAVVWGFDASFGPAVPRPENCTEEQLLVYSVSVIYPRSKPWTTAQVRSTLTPARMAIRHLGTNIDTGLGATTVLGAVGGGALGASVWPAAAAAFLLGGGAAGAAVWQGWKYRGRRALRTWSMDNNSDVLSVPSAFATLSNTERAAAAHPQALADLPLHERIAALRWELAEGDNSAGAITATDRLAAAVAELVDRAERGTQVTHDLRREALTELDEISAAHGQSSYEPPSAAVMDADDLAQALRSRAEAMDELGRPGAPRPNEGHPDD